MDGFAALMEPGFRCFPLRITHFMTRGTHMIRIVFFLTFVVVGGEFIQAMVPATKQNQRDFSNVTGAAKQAQTPVIKTHKPA